MKLKSVLKSEGCGEVLFAVFILFLAPDRFWNWLIDNDMTRSIYYGVIYSVLGVFATIHGALILRQKKWRAIYFIFMGLVCLELLCEMLYRLIK